MEYEIAADESTSMAVVHAVSAVEGRDPTSMRPLADVLDPDALDALFRPQADGTPRPGGCLTFVYSACRIAVDNGEYFTLHPVDPRIRNGDPPTVDDGVR